MKLIAHRGYKTSFIKENTNEAFINASNSDFVGFECDARKTKDGKIVICHDAFIDRVSNGTGLVSNKTYDELLTYNFGSPNIPSKIPLLESVLVNYPNMVKVIELKQRIDLEPFVPYIDDKTYFISFDTTYMSKLKRKYPHLLCGTLNYVLNSAQDDNLDIICLLDCIADDYIVKKYLKKDKKVFIYGIVGKINYAKDYKGLYYIVDKKYQ